MVCFLSTKLTISECPLNYIVIILKYAAHMSMSVSPSLHNFYNIQEKKFSCCPAICKQKCLVFFFCRLVDNPYMYPYYIVPPITKLHHTPC